MSYRGRIAPTPTGLLHLGHAATFWTAFQRASSGTLVLRVEDLDPHRCKAEFAGAAMEDLCWLGIRWQEGPDLGGPHAPYEQSARRELYLAAWRRLRDGGYIYPCTRSRKDVAAASLAPHEDEPVFPVEWRTASDTGMNRETPEDCNWRFCVPDHEKIRFEDGLLGEVQRMALRDFGDFVVWNRENIPAYELAVVVDDIAMGITEVVRGADLLTSTARQILIYRALQAGPPAFYHCPLIRDDRGRRLAKRDDALSLRALREQGWTPEQVLKRIAKI